MPMKIQKGSSLEHFKKFCGNAHVTGDAKETLIETLEEILETESKKLALRIVEMLGVMKRKTINKEILAMSLKMYRGGV